MNFVQALGRSLHLDAIRDVVAQQLPKLAGTEEAWVLLRGTGQWEALVGTARETRRDIELAREKLIEQALIGDAAWASDAIVADGHLYLPMTAGGHPVGVLGVPEAAGPFTPARRRVLAMAAALLAISIRNAQLFHEVRENSLRDGLTGCFNRTHALDAIGAELRRARRSQAPVSLIMLDIDRFKAINDRTATCAAIRCSMVAPGSRGAARQRQRRYGGGNSWCSCRRRPSKGQAGRGHAVARHGHAGQLEGRSDSGAASLGVSVACLPGPTPRR